VNGVFVLQASLVALALGHRAPAKYCEDSTNRLVQRRAATIDTALLLGGISFNGIVQMSAISLQRKIVLARLPIFVAAFVLTGSAASKQALMLQDHNFT
jgi:hypothetical protein